MSKSVQLCGCMEDEEGEVHPFVSDEDADIFSVYVGEPGAYYWVADFADKDDARMFSELLATTSGHKLDDQTFSKVRLQ